MKIHHLNVGTFCPVATGRSNPLVCHALLIEHRQGLLLIDTGFGTRDCTEPQRRLGMFVKHAGAKLDRKETAMEQVRALGYQLEDVRDIVVTHLDLDHAGGMSDFPAAQVHCFEPEYLNANRRLRGLRHRMRYRPVQWSHGVRWKFYDNDGNGENWYGFEGAKRVAIADMALALVPLPGHTLGHCGVAVEVPGGWMLHAGDAYFHRGVLDPTTRVPLMLRAFERLVAQDNSLRLEQLQRLQRLRAACSSVKIDIFCAHDAVELERWQQDGNLR